MALQEDGCQHTTATVVLQARRRRRRLAAAASFSSTAPSFSAVASPNVLFLCTSLLLVFLHGTAAQNWQPTNRNSTNTNKGNWTTTNTNKGNWTTTNNIRGNWTTTANQRNKTTFFAGNATYVAQQVTSPAPTLSTTSTFVPSDAPSLNPTVATITEEPTFEPTRDLSLTTFPTAQPSRSPSDAPSMTPPTSSLTTQPSLLDNNNNNNTPTQAPSSVAMTTKPTSSSSSYVQSEVVKVVMVLKSTYGTMEEQGQTSMIFETATAQHIEDSIQLRQEEEEDDSIIIAKDNVSVVVSTVSEQIIMDAVTSDTSSGTTTTSSVSESTTLQTKDKLLPLQVIMDVQVDFETDDNSAQVSFSEVARWVADAFDGAEEMGAYITLLQSTDDDFFQTVDTVDVDVDGTEPSEEDDDGVTPDPKQNTGIIVGAALGGAALLVLGVFGYRKMARQTDTERHNNAHKEGAATFSSRPSMQPHEFHTEIVVDGRADDISTLGDPWGGGMIMSLGPGRDERTASIGDDYDYAKQFLQRTSSDTPEARSLAESHPVSRVSSSQSGTMGHLGPIFSDDASFEQQFTDEDVEERFEINVPPGKLGMVIDTPNGDVPVVHAIKTESILYNQVKVGDQLVSVNGIDVSNMTALQVSKLISLKADQHRLLVFLRSGKLP